MVLLGLLAGLTLPSLNRWYASLQARSEASLVLEALRAQAFRAGALRRDLLLDERSFGPAGTEPGLARIELPAGWSLGRVHATVFRANGLCDEGLVALRSATDTALLVRIHGPSCDFSWQPDNSAAAR